MFVQTQIPDSRYLPLAATGPRSTPRGLRPAALILPPQASDRARQAITRRSLRGLRGLGTCQWPQPGVEMVYPPCGTTGQQFVADNPLTPTKEMLRCDPVLRPLEIPGVDCLTFNQSGSIYTNPDAGWTQSTEDCIVWTDGYPVVDSVCVERNQVLQQQNMQRLAQYNADPYAFTPAGGGYAINPATGNYEWRPVSDYTPVTTATIADPPEVFYAEPAPTTAPAPTTTAPAPTTTAPAPTTTTAAPAPASSSSAPPPPGVFVYSNPQAPISGGLAPLGPVLGVPISEVLNRAVNALPAGAVRDTAARAVQTASSIPTWAWVGAAAIGGYLLFVRKGRR